MHYRFMLRFDGQLTSRSLFVGTGFKRFSHEPFKDSKENSRMNFFQFDEHTPTLHLKSFRKRTLRLIDHVDRKARHGWRDPFFRLERDLYDLQLKEIDDLLESRGFSS